MDENKQLVSGINNMLSIELKETISYEELHRHIEEEVNFLINNDFEKLVTLLYRIDVSEHKLKNMLHAASLEKAASGPGTASLITDLIIERQMQKIKFRQQFDNQENDIDENEKW